MTRRNVHRHFAIGSALTTSLRVFRGDALAFIGLTVLAVLPMVPVMWLAYADGQAHVETSAPAVLLRLVGQLVASILSTVVFSAGMSVAVSRLRSQPPSIGASLGQAGRRWATLTGITLLFGVGSFLLAMTAAIHPVVAGLVLCTVGTALVLAYGLAYPVAVIEQLGVFASLRRAAQLTAGRRVALLALGLTCVVLAASVFFTLFFLIAFVLGGILAVAGGGGGGITESVATALAAALMIGVYLPIAAISPVVTAVAYHELRRDVDGVPADNLASVFE